MEKKNGKNNGENSGSLTSLPVDRLTACSPATTTLVPTASTEKCRTPQHCQRKHLEICHLRFFSKFGHFWPNFVICLPFLAIFGKIWSFFGNVWPFLAKFGHFFAIFGKFWSFLAKNASPNTILYKIYKNTSQNTIL